jgi:hypothetical protein
MLKFNESKSEGKTIAIKCNSCKKETYHTVVRAAEYRSTDEGETEETIQCNMLVTGTAQIIICNGCNAISFRDEYYFSDSGPEPDVTIYPPRIKELVYTNQYLRDDLYHIPNVIKRIYAETLDAINGKLPTLAGIGIRAILESICNEKDAKGSNLAKRIDELVKMSLLTSSGADILHGIRLLGNDAIHEMKSPSKEQMIAAMKVLDHLLLGVYVLPNEAKVLPKVVKTVTEYVVKTPRNKQTIVKGNKK